MVCSQRHHLFVPEAKEGIAGDVKRSRPLLDEVFEGGVDLTLGAGSKQDESQAESACSTLGFVLLELGIRVVRVQDHRNNGGAGNQIVQQLQSLRRQQIV